MPICEYKNCEYKKQLDRTLSQLHEIHTHLRLNNIEVVKSKVDETIKGILYVKSLCDEK
jgi:hypothetical protein